MAKLVTTKTINAPVEIIFEFVSDPNRLVDLWPSMTEVKNVRRLPKGGFHAQWTYNLVGLKLHGTTETVEYIANQRIVDKSKGGIEATLIWEFQSEEGGAKTKLNLKVEYIVPIPLVGRLAEAVIVSINKQEFEVMLTYLKARTEALASSAQSKIHTGGSDR